MSALLGWRLVKLSGVILFATGLLGGALSSDETDRRRAVLGFASAGFVLTWIGGWAMARAMGTSLGAPWISASMLLSIAALHLGVSAVEGQPRPARAWAGVVALGLTLALMVVRPGGAA